MARKSIKGYAEKNYYDNTRFSGITAVGDELNEGNFKHLVNFDIADTGRSLTPRKGFLTTALNGVTLSDTTIYFQDAGTGKYIFIDFFNTKYTYEDDNKTTANGIEAIPAYAADMSLTNEYINVVSITAFDYEDLIAYVGLNNVSKIIPVDTPRAESIYDEYQIRRNIIKVMYQNVDQNNNTSVIFWLEIVYKQDNSILFTIANIEDIVSINSADRNLASTQSIIPVPMQKVYTEKPIGFFNQFPLIYIKQNNKYLLETAQTLQGASVIPHFLLEPPDTNYEWAYTYDIMSTSTFNTDIKYESPIFRLSDNTRLSLSATLFKESANGVLLQSLKNSDYKDNDQAGSMNISSLNHYRDFLSAVTWNSSNKYLGSSLTDNTLILYIVPLGTYESYGETSVDYSQYTISQIIQDLLSNCNESSIGATTKSSSIFSNRMYTSIHDLGLDLSAISNICTVSELLNFLKTYQAKLGFYVKPFKEITEDYYTGTKAINCKQIALYSKIIGFDSKPLTFNELNDYLKTRTFDQIYTRVFYTSTTVNMNDFRTCKETEHGTLQMLNTLFPTYDVGTNTNYKASVSNVCTCLIPGVHFPVDDVSTTANNLFIHYVDTYCMLFKSKVDSKSSYVYIPSLYPHLYPSIIYDPLFNGTTSRDSLLHTELPSAIYTIAPEDDYKNTYTDDSLFMRINELLQWTIDLQSNQNPINKLVDKGFFEQGLLLIFYLVKRPKIDYINSNAYTGNYDIFSRASLIASTTLKSTRNVILHSDPPTYIVESLENEPKEIREFKNTLIFRDTLGDHLVVYGNNKVYISEANKYYYFKYTGVFEYPERIVKVIQYKDTLLVFTVQHLYSIFPFETTQTMQNGVDDEGNIKYTQTTYIVYNTLPVLYNLMIDEHYKDAIQVFNQMVLFYSADGQMFMIKPTATIDSNTRFSIQYFNKSANDILLNYDMYINERLKEYGLNEINKDDVQIKVLVSINYIKIFYNVPDVITYILIYDVINNRYYTYDTTTFSDIKDVFFIQNNEMYISNKNNKVYFTIPYRAPNDIDVNVDKAVYFDFYREPIACEIDSGNINLNNHLKKRFRNLHTIYKNLDANELEFSSETFLDDVPVYTAMGTHLEIRDSSLGPAYTTVEHSNKVNLLKDNTVLFNFSDYSSNKIITHKSNIVSRGKVFRVRLRFKSKGRYKFQGFGIIYKEHSL